MYPIRDDEGIYAKDVVVLKESENNRWAPIEPVKRLSFLTVPGVKYPRCVYGREEGDPPRMKPVDAKRFAVKVRTMLQIAALHGHDSVVLGASGCGAWKCPPEHVAEIFRDVIAECHGAFRLVAFAIKRVPTAGERSTSNFETFSRFLQ